MNASIFNEAAIEQLAEALARKMQDSGPVRRRLLDLKEASDYLGLTEDAIHHKVAARLIPTVRLDRKIRFDLQDLDRWIKEHRKYED